MFIGIDIGNTSTVLGLYKNDEFSPFRSFRYPTDKNITSRELFETIESSIGEIIHGDIENLQLFGMAFSSVVPELNKIYSSMAWDFLGVSALEISCDSYFSIGINYDNPSEVGIDRIVNTEAAFHEFGPGCVVIDLGTAITFDILNHDSEFDGGIIAPGIGTAIATLSEKASKLPEVEFSKPKSIVARNTVEALKSGFYYGWVSLIEGIVSRIEESYGREYRVVLTGGYAGSIMDELSSKREILMDTELTMKGIKRIYDNSI